MGNGTIQIMKKTGSVGFLGLWFLFTGFAKDASDGTEPAIDSFDNTYVGETVGGAFYRDDFDKVNEVEQEFASSGVTGKIDGTKVWIVPPTPNGLHPNQSWFSVRGAPDGAVYTTACDKATNSALYRLDPWTDMLRYVGDARSASENVGNWLPSETAEKFHVAPLWYQGRVYVGTADYSNQDDLFVQRRGFHWYAYDALDREFIDLSVNEPFGVAAAHISIMSSALDEKRGLLYALGSPTAHLYQYNIATGVTTDLGRPPELVRPYYNPGRFLWVDGKGRVYFTVATAGTLAPGEATTPTFVLSWDPEKGWQSRPDWQIVEMLRTGQWSLDHKHLYILDYPLNLYVFDDEAETFTRLGQGTLSAEHVSPRTKGIRVRSVNLSANERKLYFVNDTAPVDTVYEWDFKTGSAPKELVNVDAIDDRLNPQVYSAYTGHDSWDQQGRFHFAGFGGEGLPPTSNVLFVRFDPVRVKAALGLLPGISTVYLKGDGLNTELIRTGDSSTAIDVIIEVTPVFRLAPVYESVTIPARIRRVHLLRHRNLIRYLTTPSTRLRVIADGDTYLTDN